MGDIKMFNFWKKNNKKPQIQKSKKELATEKGEPFIEVLGVEIDYENPGQGSFELDWNTFFIAELRAKGYPGKTEEQIIDNWFRDICRHIVLETWENDVATNKYIDKKDLGNGKTEIK